MKKLFLSTMFISSLFYSQQKASVEKAVLNIQTGIIGAWISGEIKLSNQIVIRPEIGIEPMFAIGNGSQWHPNIRLEPRLYYNLENRLQKGKDITKNAGNFFGVAFNYRPNTVIFSKNKVEAIESFSIVPKWGIRRNLGSNFNYEAGAGFGYRHETDYGNFAEIDIHLRIGYSF